MRPTDDPGWDNIGIIRGSTAIYLGNGWAMTAAHVGLGAVVFPERGAFDYDPASVIRLANPQGRGLSALTDVSLFRLKGDPQLPPLMIATQSPAPGTEVVMIGNGKDRAGDITYWDVDKNVGGWIWTRSADVSDYSGYDTLASNAIRWGTNLVESDQLLESRSDTNNSVELETNGDVIVVLTEFDQPNSRSDSTTKGIDGRAITDFESQAVVNDSGGAMFFKENGRWVLGGMIVAVSGFRDQPNVTRTPLFGNFTFALDLPEYRELITQSFVLGDFDSDRLVGTTDINLLSLAVREGSSNRSFDLNRDGLIDQRDRETWVEDVRRTYFGDSNLDGEFNSADLVTVFAAGQYEDAFLLNSSWESGDWDGDGEFTTADFVLALQDNSFEQGPRIDLVGAAVVPEATSAVWVEFAVGIFVHCFVIGEWRRDRKTGAAIGRMARRSR
jgi:hypothetical protein